MPDSIDLPIRLPCDQISAFCRKWGITELALFGSVIRDDFGPTSDIDLLADFAEGTRHSFTDLDEMEAELKQLFGRDVDLAMKSTVKESANYIRRKEILGNAHVVFDSRSGISPGHTTRGNASEGIRART